MGDVVSVPLGSGPGTMAIFGLCCAIIGAMIAQVRGVPLPVGVIAGCVGMYVLFLLSTLFESRLWLRVILLVLIIVGGTVISGIQLGGGEGGRTALEITAMAPLTLVFVVLSVGLVCAVIYDWYRKHQKAKSSRLNSKRHSSAPRKR